MSDRGARIVVSWHPRVTISDPDGTEAHEVPAGVVGFAPGEAVIHLALDVPAGSFNARRLRGHVVTAMNTELVGAVDDLAAYLRGDYRSRISRLFEAGLRGLHAWRQNRPEAKALRRIA